MGSDNETCLSHRQTHSWVVKKRWLHWHDHFDYAAALQMIQLPPTLYITGAKDDVLGHPVDVEKLLQDTGCSRGEIRVLSKANGHLHDYDHINILTHPDAVRDHFPMVVSWFNKNRRMQPAAAKQTHGNDNPPHDFT
jgi:hypothetical protein